MYRKRLNEEERVEIFDQDDWTCQACEYEGSYEELEVDHIVPLSRGGLNHESNLQTLCIECNRQKGDQTMEEFLEELPDDDSLEDDTPLLTGAGGALVGYVVGGIPGAVVGGLIGLILGSSTEEE